MYIHRTHAFFITTLCIINSFNNHTFSADNPLLYADTNKHIFKHNTEQGNQALRCTCKLLNAAGERYHHTQALKFNEKFTNVECMSMPTENGINCFVISSAIILPGGKKCSILKSGDKRYLFSLQELFEGEKHAHTKYDYRIVNDPERKCCIGVFSLNKTSNVPDKTYLSLMVPSKHYDLFDISRSTGNSLKNDTFTVETYNLNKHDNFQYEVSFLFNHNKLKATKRTQEVSLAGNTVFYGALQGTTASDEYEHDCWMATDEGHIHVPEIPLEITKEKYAKRYRLKKDSVLHDIRAQKALYTYVKEGGYGLAQDIAQDGHTADDLLNFYIVATLWTNDELVTDGCLQTLCDQEIEKKRPQSKSYIKQAFGTIIIKINPFKSPFKKPILDDATIKNWNGELSGTLKAMKQNGVTSYDAYLNEVKNFVTCECAAWEHESKKQ